MRFFGQKTVQVEKKRKPEPVIAISEVQRSEAPKRVNFEIFRPADNKLIVIKKGKISKTQAYLRTRRRLYYTNHILKIEYPNRKPVFLIRWNEYYSEALNKPDQLIPEYAAELENDLANDFVTQMVQAAIQLAGMIQLDRTITTLLLLAMVFGIPIGMSFNSIFNWVPSTVVHWIP
jgi:hypothetical protein